MHDSSNVYHSHWQGTKFAYVVGNPYDEVLTCVEVITREELKALPNLDPQTARMLRRPAGARSFLAGHSARELIPGCRKVKVRPALIVRQIIITAPALVELVALAVSPDVHFYFEVVATSSNGTLAACRRFGRSAALKAAMAMIAPSPATTRQLAQYSLFEAVIQRCRGNRALDPLEVKLDMVNVSTALSLTDEWRRDAADASTLIRVFKTDKDFEELAGFLAWHAPIGKMSQGYYKVCVPPPPSRVLADEFTVRRSVVSKAHLNYIAYDTTSQQLTLRLSVAQFNASKRVRGADVRELPPEGNGRFKYVLSRGWVSMDTHAPTAGELRRAYPAGPAWSVPTVAD